MLAWNTCFTEWSTAGLSRLIMLIPEIKGDFCCCCHIFKFSFLFMGKHEALWMMQTVDTNSHFPTIPVELQRPAPRWGITWITLTFITKKILYKHPMWWVFNTLFCHPFNGAAGIKSHRKKPLSSARHRVDWLCCPPCLVGGLQSSRGLLPRGTCSCGPALKAPHLLWGGSNPPHPPVHCRDVCLSRIHA